MLGLVLRTREGEVDQLGTGSIDQSGQVGHRSDHRNPRHALVRFPARGGHDAGDGESIVGVGRHLARDPLGQFPGPDDQDVAEIPAAAAERAERDPDREVRGAERERREDGEEEEHRSRQLAPQEVGRQGGDGGHDGDSLDEGPKLLRETRGAAPIDTDGRSGG